MMRSYFLRLSLSQHYLLLSFPILLAGTLVIGHWIARQVEDSVVHRIGVVTAMYVDSFVAPHAQALLESDDLTEANRAALDRLLANTPLGLKIAGLKIWRRDGRIVYSSIPGQQGQTFPVEEGLAAALRGEVSSEITARPQDEQARHGQPMPRVIETYTPIHADALGKVIASAEFYQSAEEVDREAETAQRQSWIIFGTTMLAMYLLLFAVVRRGSKTIERQQGELNHKIVELTHLNEQNAVLHQRVRRAAERATALNEHFLQRISADLHDGPGQDLGFALMKLTSADDACPGMPAVGTNLAPVRVAVQSALTDLRAISADLQLPDVVHLSLTELVGRAVRDYESKTTTKVQLTCQVPQVPVSERIKITVCRVLQESLANVYRHAQGKSCRVTVGGDSESLTIEVRDEGPGFQPTQGRRGGRLGLAGMRERVEITGGTFTIESGQGQGTTVRVVLPLTSQEEETHV